MPFATGGNARIRTNIPAENAYNALEVSNKAISLSQLRLSTGKRINNASDDLAGYITSRALSSRNGALKAALNTVGDANNITSIAMDSLDNISSLIMNIKDAVTQAASGAMGTDEKVALAKSAYRLAQQIQTVVDSTVFGGRQLINGSFSANFFIGLSYSNSLITLNIDLTTSNTDLNVNNNNFNVNSTNNSNFAGISNLNLQSLNDVSSTDLGLFADSMMSITLTSLANALDNVTKVGAYLGGFATRLNSQEDLIKSQVVNYDTAISRLEDADVAQEQLNLVKAQFLQQASLISLSQANQNPNAYLQLIRG
jgi:flagellin